MTDFKKSFDDLAKIMLAKAKEEHAALADVTDAFKAMTAFHALQLKHKNGFELPDEGGFDFANGIEETTSGPRVSGRRSS